MPYNNSIIDVRRYRAAVRTLILQARQKKQKNSMLAALLACATTAACSTYSPIVSVSAVDHSRTIASFSDQVLLDNILRASEYFPVSYADLSSVTDSNSLQATATVTLPFGDLHNSTSRNSVAPGLTYSSSPTASIASLNNTGFVVAMMQPVSGQYLINKWNNETDESSRNLLLRLMIKSVQFPAKSGAYSSFRIVNDPQTNAPFGDLVSNLVGPAVNIEPKSFLVAESVGQPIDLLNSFSLAMPDKNVPPNINTTTKNGLPVLQFAAGLGDAQYHFGNAFCDAEKKTPGCGQLYRVYPGQVLLCGNVDLLTVTIGGKAYDVSQKAPEVAGAEKEQGSPSLEHVLGSILRNNLVTSFSKPPGGGNTGNSSSPAAASAPGGGPGASTSPQAQLSQSLYISRMTALIPKLQCEADEVVISKFETEEAFALSTKSFVHVEWRSPSDMIEYLGSILRQNRKGSASDMLAVHEGLPPTGSTELLRFDDGKYLTGNSLRMFRFVSELVNASKLSSGAQIAQPVIFIP